MKLSLLIGLYVVLVVAIESRSHNKRQDIDDTAEILGSVSEDAVDKAVKDKVKEKAMESKEKESKLIKEAKEDIEGAEEKRKETAQKLEKMKEIDDDVEDKLKEKESKLKKEAVEDIEIAEAHKLKKGLRAPDEDSEEELEERIAEVKRRRERIKEKQSKLTIEGMETEEELKRLESERKEAQLRLKVAEDKRKISIDDDFTDIQKEIDETKEKIEDLERREKQLKSRLDRLRSQNFDAEVVVIDGKRYKLVHREGENSVGDRNEQACLNQNEFLKRLKADVDDYKRRKSFCDIDRYRPRPELNYDISKEGMEPVHRYRVNDRPYVTVNGRPLKKSDGKAVRVLKRPMDIKIEREPIHVIVETVKGRSGRRPVGNCRDERLVRCKKSAPRPKMAPHGLDPVMDEYFMRKTGRQIRMPNPRKEEVVLKIIPKTMKTVSDRIREIERH
ncbi:hypothetical protein ACOME3_005230 [Neoechinorhynchus agilis]